MSRPTLDDLNPNLGKRTRLRRLMHHYGPGHGTLLLLPIDHGLEHGPVDFFANPDAADPEYQLRLAQEGGYSGIVFHYGLAHKYMPAYAGTVPLVLKLNGKTNVPSDAEAFSPQESMVEDAVRLGADAVGYTLYVGSPSQADDFLQLGAVRAECERYGMPLIIWSYPRGRAIAEKGGRDSIYAVDYAARVATELGADVVKLNVPKFQDPANEDSPEPYRRLYHEWQALDEDQAYRRAVEKVVHSAGSTLALFSGGSRVSDEDLLRKARICMEAGASGFLFGRNMWQRPLQEGLHITKEIKRIMVEAVTSKE
ncbi:MAG: fructose-bisphosphate aldolase [Anaerolineae bacterium]|jgi:fructose-bisphosphate aldolase, class I